MYGVTSRTLRHYDEIGLLPPAWTGSNGHRYYEEAEARERWPERGSSPGGPSRG
ncbi:hypothetical protein GCM10022245_01090 [Streptomyces mayteni]